STVPDLSRPAVVIGVTHVRPAQPVLAQIAAQAVHSLFLKRGKRGVQIQFQEEVNAAAQVETQLHRVGGNSGKPAWGGGREVKR
ncbi:hypothetical protein CDT93_21950, partial [Cronobacter sakazakii]